MRDGETLAVARLSLAISHVRLLSESNRLKNSDQKRNREHCITYFYFVGQFK